jgi:NitT/TauT family transport system substrate-binding protein
VTSNDAPQAYDRRRVLGIFSALTVGTTATALLSACSDGDKSSAAPQGGGKGTGPLEKVTYLTGLGATGRESHPWIAAAKGFFAEQGLEVTIQPGQAGDSNTTLLAAGKAQFASVDASGVLVRYGTGKDTANAVISAIQEQTLISIIAPAGIGITAPKDLEGRKVAFVTGGAPKILFPGYAKLAGFDPATVTAVDTAGPQMVPVLAAGHVDAVALFTPAASGVKAAIKKDVVVLPYSEYITDMFGSFLIAPKSLVKANADQVHRFNVGLMKGLAYAADHPDEAGAIMQKAVPATNATGAAGEIKLMRPYLLPRGGNAKEPLGKIDPGQVARAIALTQSMGLIKQSFSPEDLIAAGQLDGSFNAGIPPLASA